MTDLSRLSALDIARAVAAKDLSPIEVVEASLRRIDEINPSVNAIAWSRTEGAMADARRAQQRIARGDQARPLEGVPFTVKDLCATADGPMNLGSRAFEGFRPGVDAFVVQSLKKAGAILVATTTSSEFGNRPTTENAVHGITRNPWNPAHTSGGSSGGAGVAAATGIAPLNQGSDGGGSVRIPAACNGVVGLKPQRARISLGPLTSEEWGGLDVYGPITRTVADAAAFLDATAGYRHGDAYWAPPPARPFGEALQDDRRMRVAVAYERDGEVVDPDGKAAVRRTAETIATLGHEVEETQPDLLKLEQAFLTVSTIGIASQPLSDEQMDLLEPRTRLVVETGRTLLAVDYTRALHAMHKASRTILAFWDTYDVLLTPTLSKPAPKIGVIGAVIEDAWEDYRNWLCWTWPWNCTGQPAISIPAGLSSEGLPLGVQLVGGAAQEATILALAAQVERAQPWADLIPPL